jgi:hypothetical protein
MIITLLLVIDAALNPEPKLWPSLHPRLQLVVEFENML